MASWGEYALAGPFAGSDYIQSFLHPEEAYKAAEKPLNRGYEESKGYLQPFQQHGLDQYGRLNDATGDLLHPENLTNKWSQGYETSPYAKQMLSANLNQGNEAASSMGLSGSSAALGNIQQGAGNIMARDRREYLNDLMEKYMAGIGLGQNLYGVGANAGNALATNANQHGENLAGLKYGEQAAPGKLFGQAAGTALNFLSPGAGNGFTGGGAGAGGGGFNSGRPGYMQ